MIDSNLFTIGSGMRTRRKAREAALQALYQCDCLNEYGMDPVHFLFAIYFREELLDPAFQNENYIFCELLLDTVFQNFEEINTAISTASTRWSLQRMARVDRNILRMAVAEILYIESIPVNVSINEAIELAKRYGASDSSVFVNGLLDKVAANQRKKLADNEIKKVVNE